VRWACVTAAAAMWAFPAAAELNVGELTAQEFRDYCRGDNIVRCRDVVYGVYLGLLRGAVLFTSDGARIDLELTGCIPESIGSDELAISVMQFIRDTRDQEILKSNLGFAVSDALLQVYPCR